MLSGADDSDRRYRKWRVRAWQVCVLIGCSMTGCASVVTHYQLSMEAKPPEIYPGLQVITGSSESDAFMGPEPVRPMAWAFALIDMPFSFVLDTALLPFDVVDQIRYASSQDQMRKGQKNESDM